MKIEAENPEMYVSKLPEERRVAISELRRVILNNLPEGFAETMQYDMISYVIPHSLYPAGYHCDPKQALPFMSIASQKNFIAVYHMGVYSIEKLLNWFTSEYPKYCTTKLDMGKSCIRFKKMDQIPYKLIGELASKIKAEEWIGFYESNIKR